VTTVNDEIRVPISSGADIMIARQEGRKLAEKAGLNGSDLTVIATAISEVARNIVDYARRGEIILRLAHQGTRRGIQVEAQDQGPGIADIDRAMQDGYSTGKGLGLGLPGSRRLMDEFEIDSKPGKGTTIKMIKWLR
jgi:serine/threonine-protein kinase RsbT